MRHPGMAKQVSQQLANNIEQVCQALDVKPSSTSNNDLRFGRRGSLSVVNSGPKRGSFFDHEHGLGGDALDLVKHLKQCSTKDALKWAKAFLGDQPPLVRPVEVTRLRTDATTFPEHQPAKRETIELAGRIWRQAVPIDDTIAEKYLLQRCNDLPNHDLARVLRFHPCAKSSGRSWPALIALMTDPQSGEPCGIHRTFLTEDGHKAQPGKKMLGSKGVIRLWPDEEVTHGLHIAEGIETSLAAAHLYRYAPVWACADAGGMAKLPVLPGIEELTILADNDLSGAGERAAREVGQRWAEAGKTAHLAKTKDVGDFADLISGGVNAA